jgi:U3 small nucleolar RNA-associated protein 10
VLSGDASDSDRLSAKDAITARLAETDVHVLQAVYAQPEILAQLLTAAEAVNAMAKVFSSGKPEGKVVDLHLGYLSRVLGDSSAELSTLVIERVIFPSLLLSSTRNILGEAEWSLLLESTSSDNLVGKLGANIKSASNATPSAMSNSVAAKALADTFAVSAHMTAHVEFLLQQFVAPNSNARLLAHLVLAYMLQILKGSQRVDVAIRILQASKQAIAQTSSTEAPDSDDTFSPAYLEAVYTKPDATRTSRMASLSLINAVTQVVRPAGTQISWLADGSTPFKTFTLLAYSWANSDHLPAPIARRLLRSVLAQIGEEAMVFFASVWTGPESAALRTAALRHAQSFLKAYSGPNSEQVDFQLVLPALLVALQDAEKTVREAAAGLLKGLTASSSLAANGIYALDTFYGDRSGVFIRVKGDNVY